jgi:hypothetical protein
MRPPPLPIAWQLGDGSDREVLCVAACLSEAQAQRLADAGEYVGDIHPWTCDIDPGSPHLKCDRCGRVLVRAPAEPAEE